MIDVDAEFLTHSDIMEGLDTMYNISLKAVIFIDGDVFNSHYLLKEIPFNNLLLNSRRFHFIVDYTKTDCIIYPKEWKDHKSICNIRLNDRKGDSKVLGMSEQMKFLHQRLHEDIVFFIVSNSGGFWRTLYELREQGRATYIVENKSKLRELLKRCMKLTLSEIGY